MTFTQRRKIDGEGRGVGAIEGNTMRMHTFSRLSRVLCGSLMTSGIEEASTKRVAKILFFPLLFLSLFVFSLSLSLSLYKYTRANHAAIFLRDLVTIL